MKAISYIHVCHTTHLKVKLIRFWPHLDLLMLLAKRSCKIQENNIWVSFLNKSCLCQLVYNSVIPRELHMNYNWDILLLVYTLCPSHVELNTIKFGYITFICQAVAVPVRVELN